MSHSAVIQEHFYTDRKKKVKFPSVQDEATVDLSIVVPAFNEQDRITKMLVETFDYLGKKKKLSFEVIVVNDGSSDNTSETVLEFASKTGLKEVKLLELPQNSGKGYTVTQGVLCSSGKKIIFADADGATDIRDLENLSDALEHGFDIAVGSRAHLESNKVQRSAIRTLLMKGFHFYISFMGVQSVKDTQCGFKMFSRKAAQHIFPHLHVKGFIFDIEILLLANQFGYKVAEVPVRWTEIAGSKMNLIKDSIRMAIDLLVVRICYIFGIWKA